ncbi:MAG TPA: glycoside hydrolase family 16 protein [Rhizomicrobium sp.]|nr:glycoside hydrolase family 16 protein [Rhizomicrobium sp.]
MDPANLLSLTFDDEFDNFDGSPTGTTTWKTTLPHNLRNIPGTGEVEYYSDSTVGVDPFSVQDGVLRITASPGSNPAGLPYNSGVITTEQSFSQLYGYFEIRAALPSGAGVWPAFWLLPANLQGTAEVDAMEDFGSRPGQYSVALHAPATGIDGTTVPASLPSSGFHTYGVYWTPTTTVFYFDGQAVARAPTPSDLNTPMFMLADLAIASDVTAATPFPSTMQIDWIRAYAFNPAVPAPPALLAVTANATAAGMQGGVLRLQGIGISDSDTVGTSAISVTVSDKTLGMLSLAPVPDVVVTTNNGWDVKLSGPLAAVNAALATLTYRNEPTQASAPLSDTITVAATDSSGNMDSTRIAVTLASAPSPTFIPFGSTPARVEATGDDVFVFAKGEIADPHQDSGLADHIVGFHSIALFPSGGDFLAFYGFDSSARLVFDHLAAPGGVPNPSMQYYRVDAALGGSPLILVQMADGSASHLSGGDYGFYPN